MPVSIDLEITKGKTDMESIRRRGSHTSHRRPLSAHLSLAILFFNSLNTLQIAPLWINCSVLQTHTDTHSIKELNLFNFIQTLFSNETDSENKVVTSRGERRGLGGWVTQVKGIKRYKLTTGYEISKS